MNIVDRIKDDELVEASKNVSSKKELLNFFNIPINGNNSKRVNDRLDKLDISIEYNRKKYDRIVKICPVCTDEFETLKGHEREKTVCSHSCANTYFRSGEDHPNWDVNAYRTTCFLQHKKECIVCGENKIVEVHHNDNNHNNNEVMNLIPLCPTHHRYIHSRYKKDIQPIIDNYLQGVGKSG